MKIELTKDEISLLRLRLLYGRESHKTNLELLEYENQMHEFYESDNRITQRKIEQAKGYINEYNPIIDKLNKALEELDNDRS